jgi:hypothetical protein
MVTGILGDYNCEGHVVALITALDAGGWREYWDALGLTVLTFADLGLPGTTPDDELWRLCQRDRIVLLTSNRNAEGPDSLEAVIRAENGPDSLPVFTFADPPRVVTDREYPARVAERLLDYLYRIDEVRGTGRLYLP